MALHLIPVRVFTLTHKKLFGFTTPKNPSDLFPLLHSSPRNWPSSLVSSQTQDLCTYVLFACNALYSDNHMTHSLTFFRSWLKWSLLIEIFSDHFVKNWNPRHYFMQLSSDIYVWWMSVFLLYLFPFRMRIPFFNYFIHRLKQCYHIVSGK